MQYLYADQKVKKAFTPAPFAFFRGARNVKSFLVWSKNYALDTKVGSQKWNVKRCLEGCWKRYVWISSDEKVIKNKSWIAIISA